MKRAEPRPLAAGLPDSLRLLLSRRLVRDLAAAAAGAAVTLSLAPFHLWPAGILSCLALIALLEGLRPARAFELGWCYGAGLFGAGVSWIYVSIHVYGYASPALAGFLTAGLAAGLALFHAVAWAVYARWLRDRPGGRLLGFPAIWVLAEWWRSWFLTGFPWLFLGYAHVDTPLAGWAPVAGVYGVSLAVAMTASALFVAFGRRGITTITAIWLAAGLWIGGAALRYVQWVKPTGESVAIALVQPDIPQDLKWAPGHFEPTVRTYETMTAPLWGTPIIVWPEAALPRLREEIPGLLEALDHRAREAGSSLILGIPTMTETPGKPARYYNSLIALGDGGGNYRKRHLVPFGEYVPLQSWLRGLIAFFDLPMSNFSSGRANQPLITAGKFTLAPYICYEIVYPELVAANGDDADFLITISNDSWFGDSIGPLQHFQIARMRALAVGRPLIRDTNNGVTGLIDYRGEVVVRAPQFTPTVVTGSLGTVTGRTPFGRTGSAPVIGACALAVALVLARRRA